MRIAAALALLMIPFASARGAEDVPPLSTIRVADSVRYQPAPAQVTPPEVRVKPGRLVSIVANTVSKKVIWEFDPGLDARRVCDGRELILVAPASGRRTIVCVGSVNDEPFLSLTTLIVDDATPVPNPPGPTPPLPVPVPPPSPPVPDGLTVLLQSAYDGSAGTPDEKRASLAKLIDLYVAAKEMVLDPKRATSASQLIEVLRAAAETLAKDSLKPVRQFVASELVKILPSDPDAQIDPVQRKAAADLFDGLAARLGKIKQ